MIFFGSAVAQQPGEREAFLYVVAINSGDNINPDILTVVGADPTQTKEYGRIIDIKHLDQVDDNVHHFGYSLDQRRLLIPGLFSDRFYVFDISQNPKDPKRIEVKDDLRQKSGYMAPHTVSALPNGVVLVSMLGADTETTGPGGLVLINDETGAFVRHFGPGPDRNPDELGPQYMYDIVYKGNLNRLITTT